MVSFRDTVNENLTLCVQSVCICVVLVSIIITINSIIYLPVERGPTKKLFCYEILYSQRGENKEQEK